MLWLNLQWMSIARRQNTSSAVTESASPNRTCVTAKAIAWTSRTRSAKTAKLSAIPPISCASTKSALPRTTIATATTTAAIILTNRMVAHRSPASASPTSSTAPTSNALHSIWCVTAKKTAMMALMRMITPAVSSSH